MSEKDNRLYKGISQATKEEITGYYRIVFGKEYFFIVGTGLVLIEKGSVRFEADPQS